MKRMALTALVLLAVAAPAIAQHEASFTQSGTILIPGPGTRAYGGISEILAPCGEEDPDLGGQGYDGYWFELPPGVAGHAATLTAPAPNDVDAWFYSESCQLIKPPGSSGTGPKDEHAYSMASTAPVPDFDEAGRIPAAAAWVVVDLFAGANTTFTFTVPAVAG